VKIVIAIIVLLLLCAGGLAFYGAGAPPERQTVEQVIPNARFAD
jgi:hypothetical protein